MNTLKEKSQLILAHEKLFADLLSAKVINKPKFNIWMILIPIIFVFYMNDYKKYKDGRKVFADQYLKTRKRALDETAAALRANREPDLESLAGISDLPEVARQQYRKLLTTLVEHYRDLLQAEGESFESLVRSAYASKTNYLLFLNCLNNVEKDLNAALRPNIDENDTVVIDVIKTIENHSEKLQKSLAEDIFP